jgi:hypothetical protein
VNARGVARLGLLTAGLAFGAAVAGGAQPLLPTTDTLVSAATSVRNIALTDGDGGADAGQIATSSGTPAQSMGGGCERERRPSCNRPGRRSTRR